MALPSAYARCVFASGPLAAPLPVRKEQREGYVLVGVGRGASAVRARPLPSASMYQFMTPFPSIQYCSYM